MTAAASLDYLRDFARSEASIVIDETKDYLLESRLSPVANDAGVEGLDGLAARLKRGGDRNLKVQVVEALTTNETYFFRDKHPFETLRHKILPEILEGRKATKRLRIWCGAASTGQEPYTLAMVLREAMPNLAQWTVEIIATDINQSVLDKAAEGIYRQHEVNRGLPAPMLIKYFERAGAHWRVKADVRKMVDYRQLNLFHPWPFHERFDIVFLRNVLIYFDVLAKKKVLTSTRKILRDDGVLFLGGAETTSGVDDSFASVREGRTVYYRIRRSGGL